MKNEEHNELDFEQDEDGEHISIIDLDSNTKSITHRKLSDPPKLNEI